MDPRRFDRFAKAFARRRFSRRAALAAGGGATAALLGGAARRPATAQDATPAAGAAPELLFVQVFAEGTWTPKPDTEGVYLLTLTGHAAQTVYFSDRPERIVGTLPTRQFLDQLGFTPDDPPNAAVVAQTADGGEDVLVVELFDPVYEERFGGGGVSVTYAARVLAGEAGERLAPLAARQGDAQLPDAFGPASLFIDAPACPAITSCVVSATGGDVGPVPGGPYPRCWSPSVASCHPCRDYGDLDARCNEAYPACGGRCVAT